ncbi:DNA recombination protein RmuC [Zavarzinia compransoris]|uniref:DNA recombination protein RmuC homolog n=1 Tax=Zavarzinia compransoris TaxID=1264899 RepID=A0A317E011_9PROT|nr:DNA recombination protein RmuC [Zavarzinia compransoris]PWR19764.1 DNA recombination protein RmuC [Zavarzinia compransoris]TDP45134.1 DNA recombination protein RmuC [Zavarzinia compransoris]
MMITLSPTELLLALAAIVALGLGLAALLRGRGGQDGLAARLEGLERAFREESAQNRGEAAAGLRHFGTDFGGRVDALAQALETRVERLAADSAAKLEEMRRTVDEKLQGTLEQRLGESFRLVSDRLEQVHRGLGEMQTLAAGVGDLKRVLGNVKSRGIWGEMQLDALLTDILTPEQYLANVAPVAGSAERVEYVVRLPGQGPDQEVWLPIDAKFPREDYERLLEAVDLADHDAVEAAGKALETRLKGFARDIRDKYISPPRTTDFAVMFLPTEGLYAEALRRPGLLDSLQRDCRVVTAGPTTLAALLNSLQMGFRTLAIEKRSSEVWQLLGAVKTEFAKYGEVLDKVQRKLSEASQQIDRVAVRRRAIDRHLRKVESLDAASTARLIEAEPPSLAGDDDEEP